MIRDRIADAGLAAIAADLLAWGCNHRTLTGRLYKMIRRQLARRTIIEEIT